MKSKAEENVISIAPPTKKYTAVIARAHIGVQVAGSSTGIRVKRELNDRGNCDSIELHDKGIIVRGKGRIALVPWSNLHEVELIEEDAE